MQIFSYFTSKELRALILGGILSVASLYGAASGASIIATVATAILVIYGLTQNKTICFLLAAMAIPNTRILELFGSSGAICLCAIVVLKGIFSNVRVNSSIKILIILYLFYSLQFLFRFDDFDVGIVMPIKMAVNILFFYFITQEDEFYRNPLNLIFKAVFFLFVGISVASFSSILLTSEVGRMAVLNNDSNILSYEIAFVVAVLCILYFKAKYVNNILFIIVILTCIFLSILCGSRMGWILLFGTLGYSVLTNVTNVKQLFLFGIILLAAVLWFLQSSTGHEVLELYEYRTSAMQGRDDISNGRYELWEQYLSVLNSDSMLWLFGLGSQSFYGIQMQAHNFFIEEVTLYGIIGMLILYSLFIKIYRTEHTIIRSGIHGGHSLFQLLPFCIPIIGGMTLHSLTNIVNSFMLFVGIMIFSYPLKKCEL